MALPHIGIFLTSIVPHAILMGKFGINVQLATATPVFIPTPQTSS